VLHPARDATLPLSFSPSTNRHRAASFVRRNGRFAVRLFRSRWITLFATAELITAGAGARSP